MFNKPPEFTNNLKGDGYIFWYAPNLPVELAMVEKNSTPWKQFVSEIPITQNLDHLVVSNDGAIIFTILTSKWKTTSDRVIKNLRKTKNCRLINWENRIVNGTPVLYVKYYLKLESNHLFYNQYYLNDGRLVLSIMALREAYIKFEPFILEALNGIELID
jgi:hypothetical protein